MNKVTGRKVISSGGGVILFNIISCGIVGLVWLYMAGDALDKQRAANGESTGNLGILYLLLGLVSAGLISYALMQNELNEYADSAA